MKSTFVWGTPLRIDSAVLGKLLSHRCGRTVCMLPMYAGAPFTKNRSVSEVVEKRPSFSVNSPLATAIAERPHQ